MNRNRSRLLLSLITTLGLALASTGAFAQATRTWVSGVGDDANPCSRTAPCKTFAGAISKTAAGGTINVLDPGGYGSVTITKSITIDGGNNGTSGTLVIGTSGIVISAGAADVVTIRNLTIETPFGQPSASGISFVAGGSLNLQNVEIRGFGSRGVSFTPSGLSTLYIVDSHIHDNATANLVSPVAGSGGVYVSPSTPAAIANATIRDSMIHNNFGFGVRATDRSLLAISDSSIAGNFNHGLIAVGPNDFVQATVENTTITGNGANPGTTGAGIYSTGVNSLVLVSGSTITNNEVGLQSANGAQLHSFGNNSVAGNDVNGAPTATIPQM